MPSPSVLERDLAERWLDSGSMPVVEARSEVRQPYPKRSELRRAEARAGGRRGDDRRPAGGRPSGGPAGRHGPPAPHSATRSARLPLAVAPRPAVLPIPQTSDATRPAGIDVPLPPELQELESAFRAPQPVVPMVPIAVPLAPPASAPTALASDGAPAIAPAPAELVAPLTSAVEAAEWGLELEPATQPLARRSPAKARTTTRTTKRGHGLRMLVLALVVGAEGIAVTQMAGTGAHHLPIGHDTADISGAFAIDAAPSQLPAAAVLQESAERQQATAAAAAEALAAQQAQTASSEAKVDAAVKQAKAAADRVKAAAARRSRALRDAQRNPKDLARLLSADRGWGSGQFSCLVSLWNRESGWNYRAYNAGSGAYGIPQALPGTKMGTVAADWRTNPVTQIKWGLNYIAGRYGTPCGAWGHSQASGWY